MAIFNPITQKRQDRGSSGLQNISLQWGLLTYIEINYLQSVSYI